MRIFDYEIKIFHDSAKPLFGIVFQRCPIPFSGSRTYKWYFKLMSFYTLWVARCDKGFKKAGEDIEAGQAVYIAGDGKVKKCHKT